jgi:hypothetical protein
MVMGHDKRPIAVLKFRTQHLPILHAIAQYHVLQAFFIQAAITFRDRRTDPRIRHGVATTFKAVAVQNFQKSIKAMNDGCGWHGHYEHNQILQSEVRPKEVAHIQAPIILMIFTQLEFRAVGTAEGDIRVLAIRTLLIAPINHSLPGTLMLILATTWQDSQASC